MSPDYWFKQTPDKPLFPDLLWSRPENKTHAGKLLIVGGNAHGFAAPAEAFMEAGNAGAGSVRVMLPEAIRKVAGAILPEVEFAPSTPSGSFSQRATAEILDTGTWADGLLLAGEFGHNSETAILIEAIVSKHKGQITLVKDAVENFITSHVPLNEKDQLYVVSMVQLQKLATKLAVTKPITLRMDLVQLVNSLHELTTKHELAIIVKHLDQYIVASGGKVSTTKPAQDSKRWDIMVATHAAVWWLQNPSKQFEALTTAVSNI